VANLTVMDYLSIIKSPILDELKRFQDLFDKSMTHTHGTLETALKHLRQRGGKRMRPLLMLLIAKSQGGVNDITLHAAVGLELLHTASLVHDDVVDESEERRGQASVNASFNNKIAVLVGDYILSTSLLYVSFTKHSDIISRLAHLGQVLSSGEIDQLDNISIMEFSEKRYYDIIKQKTASLFAACGSIGAMSTDAADDVVVSTEKFCETIGVMFQIKDDIFDYYDNAEIGKPTGNDMREGKLTLPVIYALNSTDNEEMKEIALKVKKLSVSSEEISRLVQFTKDNGGIDYAWQVMSRMHQECKLYIDDNIHDAEIAKSLTAYIDFVVERRN